MSDHYDFERPSPPSKLAENLLAAGCLALAVLGVAVAHRAAEPVDPLAVDYHTPATMEDVERWAAKGCTTETDCARLERWTNLVCADADACEIVTEMGLPQ